MARSDLLWVRDERQSSTDVESADGTVWTDLLYKARAGEGFTTALPAGAANKPAPNPASPGPIARAMGADDLPDTNVEGAIVKRIRMDGVYWFSPTLGDTPSEKPSIYQGWFEGLVVDSLTVYAGVAAYTDQSFPHPADPQEMVKRDWLWWDRHYTIGHTQTARGYELAGVSEGTGIYWSIDTRCSRRLREWGQSLYHVWAPSSGQTVNQFCFSWSVLLQLPG